MRKLRHKTTMTYLLVGSVNEFRIITCDIEDGIPLSQEGVGDLDYLRISFDDFLSRISSLMSRDVSKAFSAYREWALANDDKG